MNEQKMLDEVTRASIQLILKEPFYGHYFSTMVREISEEVATMGVAVGGEEVVRLVINERFWKETLTDDKFKYGVLKHEILHVVFKHILRIGDFAHPEIANMAMDIVVNQYIDRDQLPGEPVLFENYTDLGITPHESVDYYYKKLLTHYQGHVNDDSADEIFQSIQSHISAHRNNQVQSGIGDHTVWKKLTEAEKRLIERSIDESVINTVERIKHSPQFGKLPQGIKTYLKGLIDSQAPVVDWKRVLRLFSSTSSRTYLKNTIKRVSKRYGTVPGMKVKHKNKLLIALDTSGSTSESDHVRFFQEVFHIYKQGAEIMIVECDTHIQKTYNYKGHMPDYLSGRGGTSFEAPLVYANEQYFPDAIIYFTDGFASAPDTVSRMPVLWVITPGGVEQDSHGWNKLPGRKVKMR